MPSKKKATSNQLSGNQPKANSQQPKANPLNSQPEARSPKTESPKLIKAKTVNEVLNKKFKLYKLTGPFNDAFGNVETTGVWFIWGQSGSGKSSFMLQLAKHLSLFDKVLINDLEEGASLNVQEALSREGMQTVGNKIMLCSENMEDFTLRLSKPKSPKIIIINSYQYTRLSFDAYIKFKNKFANKLIIIISQADGKQPTGRTAKSVMYDASLKIFVEGHKAFSKGRYIGPNGGTYTIWKQGAQLYHGGEISNQQSAN